MHPSSFPVLLFLFLLITVSKCYRLLGCYKENTVEARLMSGDMKNFPGTLTPEICISHCKSKNFSYAGVQYGQECFCSNERPSFKVFADISECNEKCDGDASKKCGGHWRINVYDLKNKHVNYVQANYMGCYADDGESKRSLREKSSPGRNEMTPEFCTGFCFSYGYRYAGVQYRTQCFCGDEIHGKPIDEGDCDLECAGDSRFLCGGNWRSGIYHTTISDLSEDGHLVGCFVDSIDHRILSGYSITLKETNSPRRCFNICLKLGFKFAGVEYGVECFCGNKQPNAQKVTNENECLASCPRNNLRACGGNWRISVYSTSPVAVQTQTPVVVVGNQMENAIPAAPVGGAGGQVLTWVPAKQPPALPLAQVTERVTTEKVTTEVSSCIRSKTEHADKSLCEGELIFHEKFNAWTPGVWKHEIFMPDAPDYEFVVFQDKSDNIFFQNGNLFIKPTTFSDDFIRRGRLQLEKCTGKMFTEECDREGRVFSLLPPVRSARITTKESFSFKFGKIVVNAKLPEGDWVLPEIWLEPRDRVYGPGYQSGRMRIAIAPGNQALTSQGEDIGNRRLEQGILMGSINSIRGRKVLKLNRRNQGWSQDFHNFTLIWSPDNISFQVDNDEIENLLPQNAGKLFQVVGFDRNSADQWAQGSPLAPFDQQFYISLGVSVGGMREFPDDCITGQNHGKPWRNMAVKGLLNFWNDRDNWSATWSNNNFGLQVEDVFVYAL